MADERTLEWARERWANTVRLAALKTGSDREGWLEDGRCWLAIVEQLAANDGLRATVSRLMRERDEARKDAAFHHDCRPNRRQAEAWRDDAKATNDRWADEVAKNRALQADVERLSKALGFTAFNVDWILAAFGKLRQTANEYEALESECDATGERTLRESIKWQADVNTEDYDRAERLEAENLRLTQALQDYREALDQKDRDPQTRDLLNAAGRRQFDRAVVAEAAVRQLAGDVRAVNAANVEVETALQEAQERWDHWHGEALGLLNERNELRSSLTRQSEGLARLIETAAEGIARREHAGQVDKRQLPHIQHVANVVRRMTTPSARAVAWLHDVLEDCPWITADGLRLAGIPGSVVASVELLTRRPPFAYGSYIDAIAASGDQDAIAVKLGDLRDHLVEGCPESLRPRYEQASDRLTALVSPASPEVEKREQGTQESE